MPQLHSRSGVLRGKRIELRDGSISVGRGLDNVLHIEDATVSHHHAELMIDFGSVMVRDLDSTNGTRVNGRRVTEIRLKNGDRVSFGEVEMLLECDAEPDDGLSQSRTDGGSAAACKPSSGTAPAAAFHSRLHALAEAQVVPDSGRCVQCGICSYNCPAGIDVRAHAWRGRPIFDSHCLTCSECVNRCPRGVLRFEKLALFAGTS